MNFFLAAQVYSLEDILYLFYLPLSTLAYQELGEMHTIMDANPISDQKDIWSYCWGDQYKSAKFYKHIHSHIQVASVYKWLWKSRCMIKTVSCIVQNLAYTVSILYLYIC
jgi:hypothetical protein